MKVLVIKPSSLGDVVHALPVARHLRRHRPDASIHWFLNRELVPLLEGDPDIERIIPFDRHGWLGPLGWPDAWQTLRKLRAERYDLILDLQGLARSGLIGWLANGARVVGVDDSREGAPLFHDRSVPRPTGTRHAVDWYLAVLRELGIPTDGSIEWMPTRSWAAAPAKARIEGSGQVWIGLQPGARWMNKRWPVESFAALARELAEDPAVRLAVFGGGADASLGAAIAAAVPGRVTDFCGKLSLPEVAEWLRLCRMLVTNDTGPMHIAAAVGTPVVALFGPTSPERTGPYGQLSSVVRVPLPCAPCMKDTCRNAETLACLRRITPGEIARTVRERLAAGGAVCPVSSTEINA